MTGGAARAADRLHQGLKQEGHTSRMLVGWKHGSDPDVAGLVPNHSVVERAAWKLFLRLDRLLSLQNLYVPSTGRFHRHPWLASAQVINLHNLHGGFISHRVIPSLSKMAPLVWTLHDMWAITGHCGFSYDCQRWMTGCGKCPIVSDPVPLTFDTTGYLWRTKDRIYAKSDLTLAVPSRWMADQVRSSPLLGRFKTHVIPFGLDTNTFKPTPKSEARKELGLPLDERIILFAAYDLTDPRKGGPVVQETLRVLGREGMSGLSVATVGSGMEGTGPIDIPYPVRNLGVMNDDRMLAKCYSAADVLIGPSLAESFGQVYLESMACGTPCVAFNNSAVPEVVRHLETGYLAETNDAAGIAAGIKLLLTDEELNSRVSGRCREIVEQEFTLALAAQRYSDLYSELIEKRTKGQEAVQVSAQSGNW